MKMTPFQLISLAVFGVLTIFGVLIFSLFGGSGGNTGVGIVTIWGTAPGGDMETFLGQLRGQDKTFQNVSYIQKSVTTYQSDLVNAIAAGTGPDLFLVSQGEVSSFADKITVIPYSALSQATYTNSFIDEGQLFLTPQGALALPFTIDPLVMYWNKNLFATAGVAQPPKYWNDFLSLAPKITSIDAGSDVRRSAVAIGEWRNINHAKEILSALFMQAGDGIVLRGGDGAPQPVFGSTASAGGQNQAQSALLFYTEFADPAKTTYSWNRALPQSHDAFSAGDVAVYFGPASEYATFGGSNPNLGFGVSMLPQIQGSNNHLTFGTLEGLAVSRTSGNQQGAFTVAMALSGQVAQAVLAKQTGLPSVRRDLPQDTSSNAAVAVFVQSALIARGWLDPAPATTDLLFKSMIESVLSGKQDPSTAVSEAGQEMGNLVRNRQ